MPMIQGRVFTKALAILLVAPTLFSSRAVWADYLVPVSRDLESAGWRVLSLDRKPPTRFSAKGTEIEVVAEASVAFLYHRVPAAATNPSGLSWRWRVEEDILPTDLGKRGADDRPLAVHVWFVDPADGKDFFADIGGWMRSAAGLPRFGRLITYVWGGIGRRGQSLAIPYPPIDGKIVILRPGGTDLGRWFNEAVDPRADHRRLFGAEPPPIAYVAISADTDDRGGRSRGYVADLRLEMR